MAGECCFMDAQQYLIRVTAEGVREAVAVPAGDIPQEMPAALLDTDVTERLRIPFRPDELTGNRLLCYLIDARSGDRGLPVNRIGTCFYLTGCPVCGDLLIGCCSGDPAQTAFFGFSEDEKNLLLRWLDEQFPTEDML